MGWNEEESYGKFEQHRFIPGDKLPIIKKAVSVESKRKAIRFPGRLSASFVLEKKFSVEFFESFSCVILLLSRKGVNEGKSDRRPR